MELIYINPMPQMIFQFVVFVVVCVIGIYYTKILILRKEPFKFNQLKIIKEKIVHLLIGNYYTEREVYKILHKLQYEMAQQTIGNRPKDIAILPAEFFKENGKYKDTNIYKV